MPGWGDGRSDVAVIVVLLGMGSCDPENYLLIVVTQKPLSRKFSESCAAGGIRRI